MPKSLKIAALLCIGLAIAFYYFFQTAKHDPNLAGVNAFGEDPYDAVGSFAVQLAAFTALLTLIRAFRPYQVEATRDRQQVLLIRGAYLCTVTVAVTLVADTIAMIRHTSLWTGVAAGYTLAALLAGMALLTVLVLIFLFHTTRTLHLFSTFKGWMRAIFLFIVGILILTFYPEEVRQSLPGALLTIAVGVVFLFVLVWAIGTAIAPALETPFEDIIDDMAAIYHWFKVHVEPLYDPSDDPLPVFGAMFEKLLAFPAIRTILRGLNPRRHPWNLPIVLGVFMGIDLLLSEMAVEGGPAPIGRMVMVATIFIGVESAGVLLGYAMFAKPLGLFRHVSLP